MKEIKIKVGIVFILTFLAIVPSGLCLNSVNETIYLSPIQMSPLYLLQFSRGDVVRWSFETHDDPFPVTAIGMGMANFVSQGQTSDSGSAEIVAPGIVIIYFQNAGSNGGYIDIRIGIRKDTIEGYIPQIFIIVLISLISIISIKKIQGRKNSKGNSNNGS